MFIHFDRIHERDGHTHTDRQTPQYDIGRACIASCGKNQTKASMFSTESAVFCQNQHSSKFSLLEKVGEIILKIGLYDKVLYLILMLQL